MNRNVFLVGFAFVALVVMLFVASLLRNAGQAANQIAATISGGALGSTDGAPSGAIRVSIASSSTKKEWLDAAVKTFNQASRSGKDLRVGGKPVFVEVLLEEIEPGKLDHYRSGTMVTDTLSGEIKPTVLSPAEASWIDQLNSDWQTSHGKLISTGKPTPLVRTPLVVAMWRSRATALGCWPEPGPACTWQRLLDLAASPDGWAMFGHPEWGDLKIGYGYVGESNSGTLTAALVCMLGAARTTDLEVADVDPGSGCGTAMATLEGAKVHSGKKSAWLLGWMRDRGPDYLDAVTTYEQDVVAFNRENGPNLREPLVAIYPQDGTAVVEHPFAILSGADWVTSEQVAAANLFKDFLLSDAQQQALDQWGLRRVDPAAVPSSPIEPRFGANPNARIATVELPTVLVMDRITEVWHQVKKHAVIAIVFDKSGSMQGQKLTAALQGAAAFVNAMDPQDELLWIPFDNRVYTSDQGLKSEVGEELMADITATAAAGGTALYDAIAEAYRRIDLRRKALGDTRRYGIVILSDGQDTSSTRNSITSLRATLAPSEGDPSAVQIHTIGIGNDADKNTLTAIATSAHGRYWDAKDPARVVDSYREIAVHY